VTLDAPTPDRSQPGEDDSGIGGPERVASTLLDAVTVVLYEPQDPINIGATVRAMKNMGVRDLRLVRPVPYDLNRIEQVAHDTADVYRHIRHYDRTEEALADCVRVAAFVGKPRAAKWARHDPRTVAAHFLDYAAEGRVAYMFGREDHGLPRTALDHAHVTVTIPTTAHASLNLAQAVLVALYEMHLQAGDATRRLPRPRKHAPPPTSEQFERTFVDVERALATLDFFKTRNPELVMRSLRSLFYRAEPDGREVDLARAVAIEVLRTVERVDRVAYERGRDDPGASERSTPREPAAAPVAQSSLAPRPPRR
jgi:tRNA/rRNA methyltransferase/tRNA (cytidine32/uridine32-2'-O)-methyltransferase